MKTIWLYGLLALLGVAACKGSSSRETPPVASESGANESLEAASATPAPAAVEKAMKLEGAGKKYTIDQLKFGGGDGISLTEDKDLMAAIGRYSIGMQVRMYGQKNPFKGAWMQKGSFNNAEVFVSFYEVGDPAQTRKVLKAMTAEYLGRKKTVPPAFQKKLVAYGNVIVAMIPENNKEFVDFVAKVIEEKAKGS